MDKFKFKIDGKDYEVVVNNIEHNLATLDVNGKSYTVEVEKEEVVHTPIKKSAPKPRAVAAPAPKKAAPAGSANALNSPLPGTILKINATVGQEVKTGDVLLVMESMKMENNILAESDGTVKNIFVIVGQSVMQGDPLVEIA